MIRVLVTDVTLTRTDHVTIGEEHGRPHDRRKRFPARGNPLRSL